MKLFKAEQVRDADAYTIAHEPISSIDLMERAAKKISEWIRKYFDISTQIAVLVGPGNNGGDGLVVARHLLEKGYNVQVFDLGFSNNYSEDFIINKKRLEDIGYKLKNWDKENQLNEFDLLIDAIFGSGLTRPIKGEVGEIIKQINDSSAKVLAVDIPSGLFGENNSKNQVENIVRANYTLTFQFPKLAFLLPENSEFVGMMKVLDIGIHQEYIEKSDTNFYLTQKEDIPKDFLKRPQFSHKGTYGHALIYAGSKGKMGASILASKACLRSGAGLVSALVPDSENSIIQTSLPEAMSFPYLNISDMPPLHNFSSIACGPGIGMSTSSLELLSQILQQFKQAMVLDADALNLIAKQPELLEKIPKDSILTPHPKELERLIGKTTNHYSRLFKTQKLAKKYQIYILIKGAYSCIVSPKGEFHFNSTGNPGMATAGSGDVLTGIITGLLAQGLNSFNALRTAVFVHGLAGDIAKKKKGDVCLIASDIIKYLGQAFNNLK